MYFVTIFLLMREYSLIVYVMRVENPGQTLDIRLGRC